MEYEPRKINKYSITEEDYQKLIDPKNREEHREAVLKALKEHKVDFVEIKNPWP